MSRSESGYWSTVDENLGPFGLLVRIENALDDGTPDAAYVLTAPKPGSLPASGWLELKAIDDYPKKPSSPLRVPKLLRKQVLFLEAWADAGGRAWLLLKAPPWHLLFDAAGARAVFEQGVSAADGPAVAKVAAMGTFPTGPMLRALTKDIRIP